MEPMKEAVKKLEAIVAGTGCEDGNVVLRVNPDAILCQFERGACMEAAFGGRTAEFVTSEPVRAVTRMGFMFGAGLEKPAQRSAASAILNVVTGFLCVSRVLRACDRGCHQACRDALCREIAGRRVFGLETAPGSLDHLGRADGPEAADLVLATGEALVDASSYRQLTSLLQAKRAMFLGPSSAGVSALLDIPHWCPYGRT